MSRRSAVRSGIGWLVVPVSVLLGLTRSEVAGTKSGKCKNKCGECERCEKGNCKKQNGKKRCKRGKCRTTANGTLCSGGTCLNGSCTPPPPPPPPPPSPACPAGSANTATAISGARRWAQTFVTQVPGQLTSAQCEVFTDLPGGEDFVLEIRELDGFGEPSATVLASAHIDDVPATPGPQSFKLTANFAPPLAVAANQGLALSVTVATGQIFRLWARSTDACPGELFFDASANETWVPLADRDMIFATTIV